MKMALAAREISRLTLTAPGHGNPHRNQGASMHVITLNSAMSITLGFPDKSARGNAAMKRFVSSLKTKQFGTNICGTRGRAKAVVFDCLPPGPGLPRSRRRRTESRGSLNQPVTVRPNRKQPSSPARANASRADQAGR
jgi:hypothetical protein